MGNDINAATKGATKERLTLKTADGKDIDCYHYRNGFKSVIVIAHGFCGHKECSEFVELASDLGQVYDVFTFDFRGHGKSSGIFTWASREEKDLRAVLFHLRNIYSRIGLIAFSLGAYVSIGILAEEKDIVQSFVAVSPVSAFRKIDFYFWKLRWKHDLLQFLGDSARNRSLVRVGPFWLAKVDPIGIIHTLTVPVLYIHGDKDWVVRHWHSKKLYERTLSRKKMFMVTDGPHAERLIGHHPKEISTLIKSWFTETL